jgi:hypothetical protein
VSSACSTSRHRRERERDNPAPARANQRAPPSQTAYEDTRPWLYGPQHVLSRQATISVSDLYTDAGQHFAQRRDGLGAQISAGVTADAERMFDDTGIPVK